MKETESKTEIGHFVERIRTDTEGALIMKLQIVGKIIERANKTARKCGMPDDHLLRTDVKDAEEQVTRIAFADLPDEVEVEWDSLVDEEGNPESGFGWGHLREALENYRNIKSAEDQLIGLWLETIGSHRPATVDEVQMLHDAGFYKGEANAARVLAETQGGAALFFVFRPPASENASLEPCKDWYAVKDEAGAITPCYGANRAANHWAKTSEMQRAQPEDPEASKLVDPEEIPSGWIIVRTDTAVALEERRSFARDRMVGIINSIQKNYGMSETQRRLVETDDNLDKVERILFAYLEEEVGVKWGEGKGQPNPKELRRILKRILLQYFMVEINDDDDNCEDDEEYDTGTAVEYFVTSLCFAAVDARRLVTEDEARKLQEGGYDKEAASAAEVLIENESGVVLYRVPQLLFMRYKLREPRITKEYCDGKNSYAFKDETGAITIGLYASEADNLLEQRYWFGGSLWDDVDEEST